LSLDVEALFSRYKGMVFRRCRALLKDESLALDAMQDVFVKLMEKQNQLTDEAPSSLLYTISTNHCLNIIRSNKRFESIDIDSEEDEKQGLLSEIANSIDIEAQSVASNMLNRLFRRQPENSQTIAVLYFYDGMTLEEVASRMGMSVSGVRKRIRQLKATLKKLEELSIE